MTSRRLLSWVAVVLLAVFGLSGCVAIKTESASAPAPGVVRLHLDICASRHTAGSGCNPGVDTAEGDNGSDAVKPNPGDPPFNGQLLVGFRVPQGTSAPDQFSSAGVVYTKSPAYTGTLTRDIAPPAGFVWVGYLSSSITFTGSTTLTSLDVTFGLPAAADGSPFAGPFRWRPIIGVQAVDADPANCASGTICYDSPQAANIAGQLSQAVSDFRVRLGSGGPAVAPGQTANLSFPVAYVDSNGFGTRTLNVAASSTLPGNPRVTPASATLPIAGNQTLSETAMVTVPPATSPGTYTVTLTATDAASGVARSNTATVTVVDRTAPTITITSPTDNQVIPVGQQVTASYGCADEANGSGLASCVGTVPNGAAINTSSLGQKTFTVNAADRAGNTASLTRTYTVVDRTPPTVTITSPTDGQVVRQGAQVTASYSCADEANGSGLASCTGSVPNGSPIDTSSLGQQTFTVTATDKANPPNKTTATRTYTVLDQTAPTITITSPTQGQVVQLGERIVASYSCADEPKGSGLASCTGPVPNGSPIDTSTPGQQTFTVTATDKANPPNKAILTRTYTVQGPPPPPPVIVPVVRPQINISLSFLFAASRSSTRFKVLAVKDVPKGATVRVTCKGKGCPKKSFTKKNASGSVSLKPYVKAKLRKGIVLTVSVTKAGAVGMVKTITIRASKAPKITTACLQPGAKKATSCG